MFTNRTIIQKYPQTANQTCSRGKEGVGKEHPVTRANLGQQLESSPEPHDWEGGLRYQLWPGLRPPGSSSIPKDC